MRDRKSRGHSQHTKTEREREREREKLISRDVINSLFDTREREREISI